MNNPLAFPIISEAHEHVIATGMTLRDCFAAKAMQSIILDPWYVDQGRSFDVLGEHIANDAYTMADAMLAEREK